MTDEHIPVSVSLPPDWRLLPVGAFSTSLSPDDEPSLAREALRRLQSRAEAVAATSTRLIFAAVGATGGEAPAPVGATLGLVPLPDGVLGEQDAGSVLRRARSTVRFGEHELPVAEFQFARCSEDRGAMAILTFVACVEGSGDELVAPLCEIASSLAVGTRQPAAALAGRST